MQNPVMQEMIDNLRKWKVEYQDTDFKPTLAYLDLVARYFERANSARDERKPLVGHLTLCPTEIFYAMDLVPLEVAMYGLFKTFLGGVGSYLEMAAQFGLPPEICSVHRATDAMTIEGAFPRPDIFVATTQTCDNVPKTVEVMAELYKSPYFILDCPYTYTERTVNYRVREYQDLIRFLEEQTGRKMDYDRLKEAVRKSYRVTELCVEINQLKKAVPAPLPCEGIFAQAAVNFLLAGTDEAVEFFTLMRDEVKWRVDHRIGAIPNERFRLLLPFVIPFWDMSLMEWMQQEHGATIVMDLVSIWAEDGKWFRDPDKPLENLARKTFFNPGYQLQGPMTDLLECVVQNAIDSKVDGAVIFAHRGCRSFGACIRSVKDELQKLGVLSVVIDCDIVDKSFTSREEVVEKLEGFFERLEERKGASGVVN